MNKGKVILITGRAGAGKTTHARRLQHEIILSGQTAVVFDGDEVRQAMDNHDFSDHGRRFHLGKIAQDAAVVEGAGGTAIVAVVAPTRELRDMMRTHWKESRLVYIPGGILWPETTYEPPHGEEYDIRKTA